MFLKALSYLRYPLASFGILFWTAVEALRIGTYCVLHGHDHPKVQGVFRFWGRVALTLFNIRVQVEGRENLPKEGVIFLFNHSSHFDIPIICSILEKTSRFGAKIELFKIPLLGMAMRKTGVLPITRSQRQEVLKLYEQSIERVHKGESFILAPEGTRQTQAGLGVFKKGPFIFAVNAQAPLVPIVIEGAIEIMPKNSLNIMWGRWRHTVQVRILPAIPTSGRTLQQVPELQAQAHAVMSAAYQSLRELSSRQR